MIDSILSFVSVFIDYCGTNFIYIFIACLNYGCKYGVNFESIEVAIKHLKSTNIFLKYNKNLSLISLYESNVFIKISTELKKLTKNIALSLAGSAALSPSAKPLLFLLGVFRR